jgi:UDP-N-acetylglucosamine/UDP-N-acetylgalactosamine 4-epimerase
LLAAMASRVEVCNQVYNIAVGDGTSLNTLFALLRSKLSVHGVKFVSDPMYRDFRAGDVRHSLADISKAHRMLGYIPTQRVAGGLDLVMPWYIAQHANAKDQTK